LLTQFLRSRADRPDGLRCTGAPDDRRRAFALAALRADFAFTR
jgi:hypothetical protein